MNSYLVIDLCYKNKEARNYILKQVNILISKNQAL